MPAKAIAMALGFFAQYLCSSGHGPTVAAQHHDDGNDQRRPRLRRPTTAFRASENSDVVGTVEGDHQDEDPSVVGHAKCRPSRKISTPVSRGEHRTSRVERNIRTNELCQRPLNNGVQVVASAARRQPVVRPSAHAHMISLFHDARLVPQQDRTASIPIEGRHHWRVATVATAAMSSSSTVADAHGSLHMSNPLFVATAAANGAAFARAQQ